MVVFVPASLCAVLPTPGINHFLPFLMGGEKKTSFCSTVGSAVNGAMHHTAHGQQVLRVAVLSKGRVFVGGSKVTSLNFFLQYLTFSN